MGAVSNNNSIIGSEITFCFTCCSRACQTGPYTTNLKQIFQSSNKQQIHKK